MARNTFKTVYISSQGYMNPDVQKGQLPGQADTKTMTQTLDKQSYFRGRGEM